MWKESPEGAEGLGWRGLSSVSSGVVIEEDEEEEEGKEKEEEEEEGSGGGGGGAWGVADAETGRSLFLGMGGGEVLGNGAGKNKNARVNSIFTVAEITSLSPARTKQ